MKTYRKILAILLLAAMALSLTGCDMLDYSKAAKAMKLCDYEVAGDTFRSLGDYKDSAAQAVECDYLLAFEKLEGGSYPQAKELFEALGDYKDSGEQAIDCGYLMALIAIDEEDYARAVELLTPIIDYKDSDALLKEAQTALLKASLSGVWHSEELDLSEVIVYSMYEALGSDAEEFLAYCPVNSFFVKLQMEFTDTGNVYISAEEESFNKAAESFIDDVAAGFGDYIMAMIEAELAAEGLTMADFEAIMGVAITPEYLAQEIYGCPIDEYVHQAFSDYVLDPSLMASSGVWLVEDGRLKICTNGTEEFAEYDPKTDELLMTGEGLDEAASLELFYPMTFTRA